MGRLAHPLIVTEGYVNLPGANGDYLSTPDHNDFDLTGDFDVQVEIAPLTWTPTVHYPIISKFAGGVDGGGWQLRLVDNVYGVWSWYPTNSTATGNQWGADLSMGANERWWYRMTGDVDNGAGGKTYRVYKAPPGPSPVWELIDEETFSETTQINVATNRVTLGQSDSSTTQIFNGKIYRLRIRNGYDGAGSLVVSADFTKNAGGTTFTDDQGHVWTKQGNASLVAAVGASPRSLHVSQAVSRAAVI